MVKAMLDSKYSHLENDVIVYMFKKLFGIYLVQMSSYEILKGPLFV